MQGPRTARARSTPGGTQSDDNMATDTERRKEAWSGYATPLPTSTRLTQRAATTVIGIADNYIMSMSSLYRRSIESEESLATLLAGTEFFDALLD